MIDFSDTSFISPTVYQECAWRDETSKTCDEGFICSYGKCIPETICSPSGSVLQENEDCVALDATRPYCVSGVCVSGTCTTNDDCKDTDEPICASSNAVTSREKICVNCGTNDDCSETEYCGENNTCVSLKFSKKPLSYDGTTYYLSDRLLTVVQARNFCDALGGAIISESQLSTSSDYNCSYNCHEYLKPLAFGLFQNWGDYSVFIDGWNWIRLSTGERGGSAGNSFFALCQKETGAPDNFIMPDSAPDIATSTGVYTTN